MTPDKNSSIMDFNQSPPAGHRASAYNSSEKFTGCIIINFQKVQHVKGQMEKIRQMINGKTDQICFFDFQILVEFRNQLFLMHDIDESF